MFENIAELNKAARWQAITDRKNALRAQARAAGDAAFSAAFSQRAREMGGLNERTRAHIFEQANAARVNAKQAVYLRAGYTYCTAQVAGEYSPEENVRFPEDCNALVSPGFTFCPDHTPISG